MNESSCSGGRVVRGLVLTDINGQNIVHFFLPTSSLVRKYMVMFLSNCLKMIFRSACNADLLFLLFLFFLFFFVPYLDVVDKISQESQHFQTWDDRKGP